MLAAVTVLASLLAACGGSGSHSSVKVSGAAVHAKATAADCGVTYPPRDPNPPGYQLAFAGAVRNAVLKINAMNSVTNINADVCGVLTVPCSVTKVDAGNVKFFNPATASIGGILPVGTTVAAVNFHAGGPIVATLSGRSPIAGCPDSPPAPPGSGLHLTLQTSLYSTVDFAQALPGLGFTCQIGSPSNPIPVTLSTDTNGNLKGNPLIGPLGPPATTPAPGSPPNPNAASSTVVGNTFSLPTLVGTGGLSDTLCVNPLLNSALGLPAPYNGGMYPQTTFSLEDSTVSEVP